MSRHWIVRAVRMAVIGVLAIVVFGYIVMALWNWLMPVLFGLRTIGFWQAMGILLLSKLLFGSVGGNRGGRGRWRGRMMRRWEQMTPEERERFRQSMRGRCGPFGSAAETQKAPGA